MKLSIIFTIFESYEATRRQALYFSKMDLPDDIEFVFVDDGSEPEHPYYDLKNLKMVYTHDKRPWTQGIARNIGVKNATGNYILCTDIDHILSKEAIMACYEFKGTRMIFPRYLAVLTEEGELTQDVKIMKEYGFDEARLKTRRGFYASVHGNTYCMPRALFWELGGNDESRSLYGHHAPGGRGEDAVLNHKYTNWIKTHESLSVAGPKIYMFTNGRYNVNKDPNPKGLFHTLSYEQ